MPDAADDATDLMPDGVFRHLAGDCGEGCPCCGEPEGELETGMAFWDWDEEPPY